MSKTRWLLSFVVCSTLALGACGDPAAAPVAPATPLASAPLADVGSSSCLAGTYFDGTDCVPADPGYYVATDGASAQTACALGRYQPNAGSTSCLLASPGHFVPTVGATAQIACRAGGYSRFSGALECTPASPGFYVPTSGATSQIACPEGTYSPRGGSTSCTDAPAGTFVSSLAQSSPTPCLRGTYQPATRQSFCIDASPGFYVPNSAAFAQTPCALGSFQPDRGQTSCLPAAIGFYVDEVAAISQTACPAGSTTLAPGATSLSQCIRPFDWQGFGAPIDPTGVNVAKAGSAVAVKFSLNGDEGLGILQVGSPSSAAIACATGSTTSVAEEAETAGGSSLTYDATTDQYKYVWKTEKGWSGTCRRLSLKFTDGSVRTADFQFSK